MNEWLFGEASEHLGPVRQSVAAANRTSLQESCRVWSGTSFSRNIIWIASYPKSGNTWVRVFLHNLLREMRGETEGAQDINALNRFSVWEHSVPLFTQALGKPPKEANAEEIARARPIVQRLIAGRTNRFLPAKTHLAYGRDHGVPTVDPEVTRAAIYLVRNPLDVVISYAHHMGQSIDQTIALMGMPNMCTPATDRHVGETMGSWSQHVESWLQGVPFPVYVMRYEDIVTHPKVAFGNLSCFLGLQPDEAQLTAAITKSSFEALQAQEGQNGFREKPKVAERFFREGRVGQWRLALTKPQILAVLRDHAEVMERLRYLIDSKGSASMLPET
ncbi:sulfotransferase domain-containing protein [Labrys neptuniae]|uniref:Sulfotransferase domain-containing protein n=1 Tax=Labrys neptuniae TaxID=376174 RepID=A0ABV3PW86_9HYPH